MTVLLVWNMSLRSGQGDFSVEHFVAISLCILFMAHTDAYLLCLSRKAAVFCKEALIDHDCTGKENKITLRVTKCRKTRHIFCSMFLLDCWHLYVSQLRTRSKDIRHVRVQISVMPVFMPVCIMTCETTWLYKWKGQLLMIIVPPAGTPQNW